MDTFTAAAADTAAASANLAEAAGALAAPAAEQGWFSWMGDTISSGLSSISTSASNAVPQFVGGVVLGAGIVIGTEVGKAVVTHGSAALSAAFSYVSAGASYVATAAAGAADATEPTAENTPPRGKANGRAPSGHAPAAA